MLKNIYRKYGEPDLHYNEPRGFIGYLNCIVPGSKIKWTGEKRRYTCIARSDNFIIVNKPFNLRKDYDGTPVVQYSILDLKQMKCNHDNLVFGIFNYNDINDCKEALEWLERSLVPFEDRFDKINDQYIPKYEGADDTLEISQRGWCNIEDVVEEIWVEAHKSI